MINKNKLFRQIHIYVSLFFLPCAVLFALTGIAYILGADQDTGLKVETYKLVKNIEPGKEKDALIQYLQENNLKVPSDAEATQGKGKGANMAEYTIMPMQLLLMSKLAKVKTMK